jgi:hypothetical protein
MDAKYEVRNLEYLQKIAKQYNAKTIFQIEYNYAFVLQLNNGHFIIVPHEIGDEGLIFYDRATMDSIIQSGKFPVNDINDIYYSNRDRLINVDQNLDYYLSQLKYLFLIEEIQTDFNDANLEFLSKKINEIGVKNIINRNEIGLRLLLCEMWRKKIKGVWGSSIIYSLNVFYKPIILKPISVDGTDIMLQYPIFDYFLNYSEENQIINLKDFFETLSFGEKIELIK